MTHARRYARFARSRSNSTRRREEHRRQLLAERLEERSLLAGDVVHSLYWNNYRPTDVNADRYVSPVDALIIFNELNTTGARQLTQTTAGSGESGGTPTRPRAFIDVNNDGYVSPIDALMVFNALNGHAEDLPDLVKYQVNVFQPGTNTPIPGNSLTIGNEYDLVVTVQELDAAAPITTKGVFSAFLDVKYDTSRTQVVVNEIQHIAVIGPTLTGASFRLTFDGQETGDIPLVTNNNTVAASIQSALEALPGINPGDIEVISDPQPAVTTGPNQQPAINQRWQVRFVGPKRDQDVPNITARLPNEVQSITLTGGAATGVFKLNVPIPSGGTGETADIPWNATATQIQTAIQAVAGAANVTVSPATSGGTLPGTPMNVFFGGAFAGQNVPDITLVSETLLPGEVQTLNLSPTPSSGQFTLVIPLPAGSPQATVETAAINFNASANAVQTAINNAISSVLGAGTGQVSVTAPGNLPSNAMTITFRGALGGIDLPLITVGATNTLNNGAQVNVITTSEATPDNATVALATTQVTVTETGKGVVTDPFAFKEAFRSRLIPGVTPTVYYVNGLSAAAGLRDPNNPAVVLDPNGIDDLGAVATGSAPFPGQEIVELVRGRFKATAAGTVIFTPDFANITSPLHDTLLYDSQTPLITGPDGEVDPGVPVTITITTGPIQANDDPGQQTNEDTPVQLDVLANDTTNPAGGEKNVVAVTQPATGGSVSFTTANVTFTPSSNFNGVTSFTYTARNITAGASSATSTATVTVTVNAVNDEPTLNAINNQNVNEGGGTVSVSLSGITPGGGPDEANQTLAVTATSSNTAVVATSVNYTPSDPTGSLVLTGGTAGTATVTVTVTDSGSNTPPNDNNFSRTFVVTVAAVNDPPVNSVPGAQQINTGQTLAFSAANSNAITISDPDAGTATVSVTLSVPSGDGVLNVATGTPPTISGNGTNNLVLTGTIAQINSKLNTLVFTPTGNLNTNGGNTTLTVLTNDQGNTGVGGPQTDSDQIAISVRPPVPPPQADNDSFNATEDVTLNVAAPGVLDGDTDPENRGPLTAVAATVTVSGGVVVLANDGSFVYTPTANFNGSTSFTYRARAADGTLSAPATVTISVAAVNDAPDAVNDDFLAVKLLDPSFTDQVVPVLANDTDVDGDSLTVTALNGQPGPITTGAGATVRISASGQVLYTPAAGFTGSDSFTYTISDGNGGTDTATVSVQVVDFVPKDVSGVVYLDTNNNGVVDGGETRLAGVTVVLTGTDFGGTAVNLTRTTDVNGVYTFAGLRPGNYRLVQNPVPFLIDGLESESSPLVELTTLNNAVVNDSFTMSWGATDRSGPITGVNFGERGVNVADPSLTNTAGLMQEMFSTSSRDGYILAANAQGRSIWGWALNNWGNFTVEVFINPSDLSTAVLTLNGTTQIRIYQDPARNGTNTIDGLPTPQQGSMARFRILAYGTEGRYIIRLDGKLSDFAPQQQDLAANQQPQAQGEGAEFAAGADAVFGSDRGWA